MNIQEIKKKITSFVEDERLEAWWELYYSKDPVLENLIQEILEGRDSVSQIAFLRFLSKTPEEQSVNYIIKLLESENSVVYEAAKRAFVSNLYDQKIFGLNKLLGSESKNAIAFAIEQLSMAGFKSLLPILSRILRENDRSRLLVALEALRHIADKKILDDIEIYENDAKQDVRFKVLLIYAALFERGYNKIRKKLFLFLEDEDISIRKTAIWALSKRVHRSHLPYFLKISSKDESVYVRQEAVSGLQSFLSLHVVSHLIYLIAYDNNHMVRLKAETVLMNYPHEKIVPYLRKFLKSKDERLKTRALFFLAELQYKSKAYFKILFEGLKKTEDHKEKIFYLRALGLLHLDQSKKILKSFLNEKGLLSYTALISLLKHDHEEGIDFYIDLLNINQRSSLHTQTILKRLVTINKKSHLTEHLKDILKPYLRSETMNIRYFSATILSRFQDENISYFLFNIYKGQDLSSADKFIKDILISKFSHNPNLILDFILFFKKNSDDMAILFMLLNFVSLKREEAQVFLKTILKEPFESARLHYKSELVNLYKTFLKSNHFLFEEICSPQYLDEFIDLLGHSFDEEESLTLSFRNLNLEGLYEACPFLKRDLFLKLLAKTKDRFVIPFLVRKITSEEKLISREIWRDIL